MKYKKLMVYRKLNFFNFEFKIFEYLKIYELFIIFTPPIILKLSCWVGLKATYIFYINIIFYINKVYNIIMLLYSIVTLLSIFSIKYTVV